jgi:isoquinoline 1-oxidoreductase subunit beta
VVAQNGACYARKNVNQKLTYGQIIKAKQGEWVIPTAAPVLKPRKDFVSIGKNMPRLDTRAKLLGEPVYAFDAKVKNMLFGAVARAPRFGAKLAQASEGTAAKQPGVIKVVIDREANFAGVVAKTRTQARNALAALELTWEGGTSINQAELEALVTAKPGAGVVVRKRGNAGLASIGASIEASYRTPFAAHAHLEPLAATVHVQDKLIEAWVPTQMTTAETRALEPWAKDREIKLYPMQMGGSFGRKGSQTATGEAARLSAAAGQAVSVAWTREEEMQHSIYRPPSHTFLRGSLSNDGKIQAIQQVTASGDIIFSFIAMPEFVKNTIGIDFGVIAGLFSPYAIANYEVRSQRVGLPIPTGAWRGVGLFPNVFALESFMDELALAAGKDPLEFRLEHVPPTPEGERMRRVLEDVRERSGWTTPVPEGRARGVTFCIGTGTHVAMVVEVSARDNEITVERVTVSLDAGLVINPTNATLQAKGSVVMGISSTLIEAITIKDGAVEQSNFKIDAGSSGKAYPLLTLKQTPRDIEVHFLEGGDEPQGMGEPVIGPVGAAIANAVYALTKNRLRDLPLKLPA